MNLEMNEKFTKKKCTGSRQNTGVDFIFITAFMLVRVDPESVKKIDNLTVFFTLLGSALKTSPRFKIIANIVCVRKYAYYMLHKFKYIQR